MQQRRKNDQEIGGADIPQAFPDESPSKVKVEKYHRRKRNGKEQQGNGWIITFVLLTTFVLVASYFLVSHHEKLQLEHLRRDIIHDEMEPLSREWEEKYSQLEDENLRLKKEAQEYTRLREENENLMERSSHANKLRGNQNIQIEQLSKYKKKIQENLQLMSKTALLEK